MNVDEQAEKLQRIAVPMALEALKMEAPEEVELMEQHRAFMVLFSDADLDIALWHTDVMQARGRLLRYKTMLVSEATGKVLICVFSVPEGETAASAKALVERGFDILTAERDKAYQDDSYPERKCHYEPCGKPYRGPAVYCSWPCAVRDA